MSTADSFILKDAVKQFTGDQDKTASPEKTVAQFKKKAASGGFDILAETRRIDNGRLGIPVFFSVCTAETAALTGTKKQMGKGATAEQAEASAVMELAERFSFYRFASRPENFVTDTRSNLKNRAAAFAVLARSVHDAAGDAGQLGAAQKLFDDLPGRWTTAHNLTTGGSALIPFDWFFAINEFNGTSAGNCNEEAICQGLCEVIERHVSCLIGRERRVVPAIDPQSAGHPAVTEMLAKYQAAGIDLYFSDFTLDTGIPTVGVLAHDPETFPEKSELVWTAGAAPDPEKAMSRAMTEAAQLGGDFNTSACFVESGLPKFKTIDEAGFIMKHQQTRALSDLPNLSDNNIKVEIERCLSALSRINMDVWVVDLTDPLLKIPAFYTIIPGAAFFQRSENASAAMFTAKLMAEAYPPNKAIAKLTAADNDLGNPYFIRFYIGLCHLQLGQTETALDSFRQALDREPSPQDRVSVLSYTGLCLKDLEQYQSALDVLADGLALDGDRTDILNLMGVCHFKLGEHEQAIDCFKKIIRLDPSSAIDYANIGVNYDRIEKVDKAIYYYQRALDMDPTLDFARNGLEKLARNA